MSRAVDVISVLLLAASAAAFAFGVRALGDRNDLGAIYWLVIGALALRSATDLLRPKGASR